MNIAEAHKIIQRIFPKEANKLTAIATLIGCAGELIGFIMEKKLFSSLNKDQQYAMVIIISMIRGVDALYKGGSSEDVEIKDFTTENLPKEEKLVVAIKQMYEHCVKMGLIKV